MNESDYWKEVQLLSGEIENTISVFDTYEEINRLAVEDPQILKTLNKEPLFWNVQSYSLQTTLLIVLGRIFDTSKDSHSIHGVVNATVGNIKFFSKLALEERKIKANGGKRPDWLDGYVANAWEPRNSKDLRHLKKTLCPYSKVFEKVYRPIRNKIFAHKITTDDTAVSELFRETSREQLGNILDVLHGLITAIEDLYLNGHRPELGKRTQGIQRQPVRRSTEDVLRTLAKGYT